MKRKDIDLISEAYNNINNLVVATITSNDGRDYNYSSDVFIGSEEQLKRKLGFGVEIKRIWKNPIKMDPSELTKNTPGQFAASLIKGFSGPIIGDAKRVLQFAGRSQHPSFDTNIASLYKLEGDGTPNEDI